MTAAAVGVVSAERVRWRMGVDARALVLVTSVLLAFGLAVLYSASAYGATQAGLPSSFYLVRQLAGAGTGIILFSVAAKFDVQNLRPAAWPIVCLAIGMMLALLVLPGVHATYGSKRFLFGSSIQPSEFAKLAVVVWAAMLVDKKGEDGLRRLSKGLLPFIVIIGFLDLLAALEPDYSVALHFTVLLGVILYAGGARIGHFVFLSFVSIPVMWAVVQSSGYARERVMAFLNPVAASQNKLYQLTQSLVAAGSGGFLGVGFGQGRQQMGYVLFPHSDFIGSVVAEEWGFVGVSFVTGLFALYGWLGFRIARQAKNKFQQLVAIGLTVNMIITAYVHMGVVIGLLPTTGLTLPFISYGRSNLLLSFLCTGILCNIGSVRERVHGTHATNPMAAPAR